ncbi:hypothetical protein GCM10010331_17180 [Streptomyces xanthochromogenes]|nr:hypothetical protein GCM10010331_17180 [Streptomyces xanthochromogenes]
MPPTYPGRREAGDDVPRGKTSRRGVRKAVRMPHERNDAPRRLGPSNGPRVSAKPARANSAIADAWWPSPKDLHLGMAAELEGEVFLAFAISEHGS